MTETIISIDGMMCPMCEAHVNEAIRKAASVKKVKASHKKGEAVILSEEPLNETDITKAVNDTGYSVTGYLSRPYVKKGLFGRS